MIKLTIERKETPHGQQWIAYTYRATGIEDTSNLVLEITFTGENSHPIFEELDPRYFDETNELWLEKRRFESGVDPIYPNYAILFHREPDGTLKALARTYYSHLPQLEWKTEVK